MTSEWKKLIELLQSQNVEFVVVGAHALAFYGHPRFTSGFDIFVKRSTESAFAIKNALTEFGIPLTEAGGQPAAVRVEIEYHGV